MYAAVKCKVKNASYASAVSAFASQQVPFRVKDLN